MLGEHNTLGFRQNPTGISQLRDAQPSVLVLDLGTNDLCSNKDSPLVIFIQYCVFLNELQKWGINPDVIVLLQVLPRVGGLRHGQVTLDGFQ